MTTLSEDDWNTIKKYPLNNSLDQLQDLLQDTEDSYTLHLISDDGARLDKACQMTISQLLSALQVKLVIQKESDFDIWNTILTLITDVSPATSPPCSITPLQQTPWLYNTSSFSARLVFGTGTGSHFPLKLVPVPNFETAGIPNMKSQSHVPSHPRA
ncbi:uncharacterized protein CIMG_13553 [Coccidioides immitis RS]|uniref:Uncharacterized protein n=1 Tax=Coccidioides immitis (strain RS) TaxID=246410 RepID=A0A0D8JVC2_COCIM|nr:uncharacterized protein CIMG_13553 [Coccidioides immitis RS]KJF61270.1 hypothetical protein CIMG_13553 [Coccidioides immitis RS]